MVGKVLRLALVLLLLASWTNEGRAQTESYENPKALKVWLTISARKRFLEVSWSNAPANKGDQLLVTREDALSFQSQLLRKHTPLAGFPSEEGSGSGDGSPSYVPNSGFTARPATKAASKEEEQEQYWVANGGATEVVAAIEPRQGLSTQWFTTGLPFDYALSRNATVQTACYGFWASYIDAQGNILAKTCLKVFPRWMNDLKSKIGEMRLRDLFIPGTHDSGSYRPNFDPLLRESLVTKYALTQDDDIRGQLMHGVRYLDIRVGYYRNSPDPFFIYHGITKQRPLQEVINQVRDFVYETNEIIIFGLKEFPVGKDYVRAWIYEG